MTDKRYSYLEWIVVALILAFLIGLGVSARHCHQRGGKAVPGFFWIACVRGQP